jgi:hypothetical protein
VQAWRLENLTSVLSLPFALASLLLDQIIWLSDGRSGRQLKAALRDQTERFLSSAVGQGTPEAATLRVLVEQLPDAYAEWRATWTLATEGPVDVRRRAVDRLREERRAMIMTSVRSTIDQQQTEEMEMFIDRLLIADPEVVPPETAAAILASPPSGENPFEPGTIVYSNLRPEDGPGLVLEVQDRRLRVQFSGGETMINPRAELSIERNGDMPLTVLVPATEWRAAQRRQRLWDPSTPLQQRLRIAA